MIECPRCRFLVDGASPTCRFCGANVEASVLAGVGAGIGAAPPASSYAPPPTGFVPPPPGHGVPPRPPVPGAYVPAGGYGVPIGRGASRAKAMVPVAIGVVVLLIGASLVVLGMQGDGGDHPSAWDPQVKPLVDFVERERGLEFDHPVHVDFKPEQAFREATAPEPPTDEEKLENTRYSAFMRAVGLVSGEFDLASTGSSMTGDAALAFYDFRTKRITVRGDALSDANTPTVVHELTHALQDQEFDLGRLHAEIDDEQREGFQAVVEGDAERIEYRYLEELSGGEPAVEEQDVAAAEGSVYDRYPPALVAIFTAPYALGHPLVLLLEKYGDVNAIDDAIMNPPRSSEYMVNPFEYIDGNVPATVPTPAVVEGETTFDDDVFGPLVLFLMLQERLGAKAALKAVDGWGGDRYVAFEREQRVCMRVDFRGDTPAEQEALVGVLGAWRDTMPAGAVTVTAGEYARMEACDAGVAATFPKSPDGEHDRLLLPGSRSMLALEIADDDLPETFVRCTAQAFIDDVPMSDLASENPDPARMQAAGRAAAEKCVE